MYVSKQTDSPIVQKYQKENRIKNLQFVRNLVKRERIQKDSDVRELKKVVDDYKEGFKTIRRFKNDVENRKELLGKLLNGLCSKPSAYSVNKT